MLGTLPLWLHVVAAMVWVGSQIMMFAVVVPSIRLIDDARARHQVLRGVTSRFGYLGFAALVLLVLTGIENIDRYSPSQMFDYRYGYILAVKLLMLVAVGALTALHTLRVGPALLALQARELEAGTAVSRDEMRSLRLRSVGVSSLTLVLSLAIVFCAALLGSGFSYERV